MYIQWNCSIADTIGPKKKESVLIREVSLISEVGLYGAVAPLDKGHAGDHELSFRSAEGAARSRGLTSAILRKI